MLKKEKRKDEELKNVAGGSLDKLRHGWHSSSPHKCPICGEEYYLGDAEISLGMCQKCSHDPNRLWCKKNKDD